MIILFVGFLGFLLLFIAYTLCLFGKITQEDCSFNLMNVFGAALITYHAYKVDGWFLPIPPLLWTLVSLYYIIYKKTCIKKKAKKKKQTK